VNTIVNAVPDIKIVSIGAVASGDEGFMALDDRMLKAYGQAGLDLGVDRKQVVHGIEAQSGKLSDPGHLFDLQQRISDYSLQVSLISTLTRKGVGAVETLLKS
jgi:hypothetical protein